MDYQHKNNDKLMLTDGEEVLESLKLAVQKFVLINSDFKLSDISGIELREWRPLKVSINCSADLRLSYVSGKVNREQYSQALIAYESQKQLYQNAYNQYVQAKNQYAEITRREKNLEWHQKSKLIYPISPNEPTAPESGDYITWNTSRSSEIYSSTVVDEYFLYKNAASNIYFRYLYADSNSRKTYGNLTHKFNLNYPEAYLGFLNTEIFPCDEAGEISASIKSEIEKDIIDLFYLDAKAYMEKWYFREMQIERFDYKQKTIKFHSSNLYAGNYFISGKSYNIVIDCSNNKINGDLPSDIHKFKTFFVMHVVLLVAALLVNLSLFSIYWEEFTGLILILVFSNYLGFILTLYSFPFLSRHFENNSVKWSERLKAIRLTSWIFCLSNTVSIRNSGLYPRIISMKLSEYWNRSQMKVPHE
jgi:hypothetical protein